MHSNFHVAASSNAFSIREIGPFFALQMQANLKLPGFCFCFENDLSVRSAGWHQQIYIFLFSTSPHFLNEIITSH